MPQNRDHHGELLPNGFHVGDYVTYNRTSDPTRARSGYVTYHTDADAVWATFDDSATMSLARFERGELGSYLRPPSRATLIRRHDGTAPTSTEGSTTMSITFNGQEVDTTQQVAEVLAGVEYRVIYPQPHHNFEFIGRARYTEDRGSSASFEIVRWVLESERGGYVATAYPVGYVFNSTSDWRDSTSPTCLWLPVTPEVTATEVQEEAYDGQKGAFLPHGGEMPEPGTIVRGLVHTTNKQVEGLFLRLGTEGTTADVECKRRRTKRANGTFGEWETYSNTTRRAVTVDGAEVFKPGAAKPGTPTWMWQRAVIGGRAVQRAEVGEYLSGPSYDTKNNARPEIYRGVITNVHGYGGEYTIRATERAQVGRRDRRGEYDFRPIPEQEIMVFATFASAIDDEAKGAYVWTRVEPGVKPVDPAFDPNRKTPYTGQKIGDVVVGLLKDQDGRRDTVSSWVRGEIVKWNVRYGRPIVKVTDKMESTKKVDAEVELVPEDTYPAMADPSAVSPEEYKRTLRLYLIGRHKRGDFCRGGLNTMLAAHGIPLYETRRRAQMVVTVDYDPNETDLYTVQQDLRSKMAGVSGLSFAERSGEDIELNLESDVTTG